MSEPATVRTLLDAAPTTLALVGPETTEPGGCRRLGVQGAPPVRR